MRTIFQKLKILAKTIIESIRQYQEYRVKNKTPYL